MISQFIPLHTDRHMTEDEKLVSLNVYGRDGVPVCRMGGNRSGIEPSLMEKHEEFARLFAAAPELLETLHRLLAQAIDACGVMSEFSAMPCKSLGDKFPTTVVRLRSKIDEAQRAIHKAEGRS